MSGQLRQRPGLEKCLLALVILLLPAGWTAPAAHAAIGFSAASSCTPAGASSFTWSHTTGGPNRVLVVGVSLRNSSSQTVSSVTYASKALTLIGAQNNGTSVRVELWRLVAPPTGANDVVVTLSGSAKVMCGAVTFTGVDQFTPIDASAFASGGPLNFDKVWDNDNPAFNDETTDAASTATADVTIFRTNAFTAGDYFYVGRASKFTGVVFDLSTNGNNVTLAAEYWNGSAWTAMTMTDNTQNLTKTGEITFPAWGDWATNSVNGSSQYWVRFKTTTNPTTAPVGTQVRASNPPPKVTVTTVAPGTWVVDVLAFRLSKNDEPTGTAGLGQTEKWSGYTGGGGSSANLAGKGSIEGPVSPAGAMDMDWTLAGSVNVSVDFAIGAVSLRPALSLVDWREVY